MFLSGKKLYQVLERCNDLFPAWKKEGNGYWNCNTGEIVCSDGTEMHDLVDRICVPNDEDGWVDGTQMQAELELEDCNDSIMVDPLSVRVYN